MTPTATGRHCTTCQHPVVDFTQQSDAEILAYLARAAGARTCGRFAAGQLERPLQRAAPAAPTRWRAWLAAAGAVWALREVSSLPGQAQAPAEWRARYWGGPAPVAAPATAPATGADGTPTTSPAKQTDAPASSAPAPSAARAAAVVRGTVRDSAAHMGMPGVTILLKGTQIGTSTNVDGAFELAVPADYVTAGTVEVQVSSVGYVSQTRQLLVGRQVPASRFYLEGDVKGMLGEVVVTNFRYRAVPPAPWRPRALYQWGRYWLTRPFRRF